MDEIPLDSGGPEQHLKYRCKRCGYSEWVPAWVIDEFAMGDEQLLPGELPETCCPKCPGAMAYTGDAGER
jgi:hypothetical protein